MKVQANCNNLVGLEETVSHVKILWDFNIRIQCDHVIECRRPDIVVVLKKEKEYKIIDIAVPEDCRIGIKETEKVEKYEELKREIRKIWAMKRSRSDSNSSRCLRSSY
jgi:hypothetical protein